MKSFLRELRDAASTTRNLLTEKQLKDTADEISAAVDLLFHRTTTENMQTLNGLWAKGQRYLMIAQNETPADPTGGQSLQQRLAA